MMPLIYRLSKTIIAASCLGLAACSNTDSNTEDNAILFEPCNSTTTLECGAFEVPLIHDSTDNRRISIDVARLPGVGNSPREPLLLNVGGPGSGIELLQEIALFGGLPDSLLERYDIIGIDQRGVSNPLRVDCDQLGRAESLLYPRSQREIQDLATDSIMLAAACSAEYTDSLQWVGSNAVVQDMDILRAKLNSPKLNIIGVSFGTRSAMLYLQRYPENAGRVVLDAPLRPSGKIDSLLIQTAAAQQRSFERMLNACGTTLPDCDRATVESAFVARANHLIDTEELETFEAFLLVTTIAIEETDNGEFLAPLLIDFAYSGDSTEMLALIEEFDLDEGDEPDQENSEEKNASITLERAVICADDDTRPSTESLLSTLTQLNEVSDFFAEALLPLAASCIGWPEALDPMVDIQTSEAPSSLVIGGSGDVLTPRTWAIEVAEAIGGAFLASDHLGHTVVFQRENNCVDDIVVEFLVNGQLPPKDTTCN